MRNLRESVSLLSSVVVLGLLLYGCSADTTSGLISPTGQATQAAASSIDGAALYNSDCSGCHGSLATSGKKGTTADKIKNAIAENKGGMAVYATLTSAEIDALVAALATTGTPTTTPPATTSGAVDGAALYSANCSGCHGPLDTSGKKGATLSMIQAAIANNAGGMGRFASFSMDQLQAIAGVLATSQPAASSTSEASGAPLDGAALYTAKCGGCHGPLATSSKTGATAVQIHTAISNNRGGMAVFSSLTIDQIQAIAAALAPVSLPAPAPATVQTSNDGTILYATYCAGCHGPLATSSKTGATATMIQTGISGNYGGMGKFSSLTTAQVQSIAAALGAAPAPTPAPTPTPSPTSADGATLYTVNCSSCHGALATSAKRGATASQIQTGISGVSAMNRLSSLTPAQIQAIATALGTTPAPTPTPVPAPTDGASLYTTNCSSCHGALASSSKRGATASQITSGIRNVSSMSRLSTLTTAQIQAIATALGSTPAPTPAPTTTDGAALYTTNCSSCHGALASSSKRGATASQIKSGILNVSSMSRLSTLTTAQIQAIATALGTTPTPTPTPTPVPTPTPTDGATLYVNNCSSCHGPLATSAKAGATAAQIQSAITNNRGGMGKFSNFTTAQVQSIADALAATAPVPVPTDGASLYTNYCSSCHGTLSQSSVSGATASEIRSAISGNKGGMGQFSSLTTTQVQIISDALAQSAQGGGGDD